jgi:hypothetical protein
MRDESAIVIGARFNCLITLIGQSRPQSFVRIRLAICRTQSRSRRFAKPS